MTTALFMLRCVELGISIFDLEYMTVGLILDMFCEKSNDEHEYAIVATQDDFDHF